MIPLTFSIDIDGERRQYTTDGQSVVVVTGSAATKEWLYVVGNVAERGPHLGRGPRLAAKVRERGG